MRLLLVVVVVEHPAFRAGLRVQVSCMYCTVQYCTGTYITGLLYVRRAQGSFNDQ